MGGTSDTYNLSAIKGHQFIETIYFNSINPIQIFLGINLNIFQTVRPIQNVHTTLVRAIINSFISRTQTSKLRPSTSDDSLTWQFGTLVWAYF